MGVINFLKKSVSDLFIARPDEAALSLIWRYPDQSIPFGAKLTVRADECALFFKEGRLVGEIPPGTLRLDTANLPFLGDLIVSPLTGDNHFITELFFVRKAEHLHRSGPRLLGKYADVASRNVVSVLFSARFGLRVTNAAHLVVALAGIQQNAHAQVAEFLDARVASLMAAIVGRLLASEPVLQVVSNQYSEEIGQQVIASARQQFTADGLELTRFLELQLGLTPESEASLQEFGRKMADLSIQREGAEIAAQPGYAQFNLVQGQRALLEGMGKGVASGNVSSVLGLGIGGGLPGPMLPSVMSAPALMSSNRPSHPKLNRWYLRTPSGIEGPYSIRQVALRAAACELDASTAMVRRQGEEDWISPEEDSEMASEFARRASKRPVLGSSSQSSPVSRPSDLFESTFLVAVADKVLTRDELEILAKLAVGAGLAADDTLAREYVITRARALGCRIDVGESAAAMPQAIAQQPPGPPPFRPSNPVYVYSNGIEQVQGLTAEAVVARVRAAPDGVHMVWATGMADWQAAGEVPAIRSLLGG